MFSFMKLALSLGIAATLFGVLLGLQAAGVGHGVAALTSPLTCDGTVVTGRSTYSEPGETTTTLSYFCESVDGDHEEITGRVTAVEFFYAWLLALALMAGVVRLWKAVGGDELLEDVTVSGEEEETADSL